MSTKDYYDGIAQGYKNLYHGEQMKKIRLIRNSIPETGLILDLGSGDGVLNEFVSENAELISVDLSIELLKLNENKNKINANILKIPFQNGIFDSIILMTVIQDIPNTKDAIKEIRRILKPEGKLIISFLKISSKREIIMRELEENFKITKQLEEEKDIIIIGTK